jgi:hypothetical protein
LPEWSVCAHCNLKHTRRPDGLCPRCHEAVGEKAHPAAAAAQADGMPDVYDGRAVGERPAGARRTPVRPQGGPTLFGAASPPEREELPVGVRIAGAILVANGLALMIESGLRATMEGVPKPPLGGSPIAMLIDLVLGGMLLTGNGKALPWVKVRVVLGGLILPAVFFAQGETFMGGMQLAFSGGLALMLFGDAGKLRIAAGLLGTGFGLVMETIGLFAIATGTAPLAHVQMAGSLESDTVSDVVGNACAYRLTAGGNHWYLRKDEAAKKDNALADRWLVWPSKDAHVVVIAEKLDSGITVDMDRFAEVILGNVRKASPDVKVLSREALPGGGTRLHTQATVNGLQIESYYGLYAREPWIFQVIAFTGQRQFASVESELASLVASFQGPGA